MGTHITGTQTDIGMNTGQILVRQIGYGSATTHTLSIPLTSLHGQLANLLTYIFRVLIV